MAQLKRYNGSSWETVGGTVAEDTLPINAVVEYTGSTVPTGYELVEDYSTSEIDTGKKWIDGKDIYRICKYVSSFPNTAQTTIDVSSLNIDYVVILYGFAKQNTTNISGFPINNARPDSSEANSIGAWIDNNNIKIAAGSDRSNCSGYIILEYTKKTN